MNILIYCIANFMFAAIETDVVHHRTARWEKDSQRKPGKPASRRGLGNSSHRTCSAKVHKYSSVGQPGDRLLNIKNIKDNQYDLCCCAACYHCLALAEIWFLHIQIMQCSFTKSNKAKVLDSKSVFVFSLGGVDSSQFLLIEKGRIRWIKQRLLSLISVSDSGSQLSV